MPLREINAVPHLPDGYPSPVKIDIFGCCVSRDIFGMNPVGYKVELFLQNISPLTFLHDHLIKDIGYKEYEKYSINSGFIKWQIAELNGSSTDLLSRTSSEWIVVDVRPLTNSCLELKVDDMRQILTETEYTPINLEILKSKKQNIVINAYHATLEERLESLDIFAAFLNARYGGKVILIETSECGKILSKEGNIQDMPIEYGRNDLELKCFEYLKNKLDCFVVEKPAFVLSDESHPWGKYPVHMVSEYYSYAKSLVDYIIVHHSSFAKKTLNEYLHLQCLIWEKLFEAIYCKKVLSFKNTETRVDEYLKHGEFEKAMNLTDMLSISDPNGAKYLQSKIISIENNPAYDLLYSKMVYEELLLRGYSSARAPLCGLLCRLGDKESLSELLHTLELFSRMGDYTSMGELAQFYSKDHINHPKNLELSKMWMKNAIDCGLSWGKKAYFDLLWESDTASDYEEMYNLAYSMVEQCNNEGYARLALLYKKGIYVEKNLYSAAEYMRIAKDKKILWARWELFDILWEMNDPALYGELYDLASSLSDENNMEGVARLGLLYKYGRGVDKNHDKSKELFKLASDNIPWVRNE